MLQIKNRKIDNVQKVNSFYVLLGLCFNIFREIRSDVILFTFPVKFPCHFLTFSFTLCNESVFPQIR
jgi:hypothetical protein